MVAQKIEESVSKLGQNSVHGNLYIANNRCIEVTCDSLTVRTSGGGGVEEEFFDVHSNPEKVNLFF